MSYPVVSALLQAMNRSINDILWHQQCPTGSDPWVELTFVQSIGQNRFITRAVYIVANISVHTSAVEDYLVGSG